MPLLWILPLVGLLLLGLRSASMRGDGLDYLLYARAFASHLSPDIRSEDFAFGKKYSLVSVGTYEQLGTGVSLNSKSEADGLGYIRTTSGSVFNYHFWLYPLLVSPVLKLITAAGLAPFSAFALVNFILVSLTILYVWNFWSASALQRHLLTGMIILSGTPYYIAWPHPEVFTASLIAVALMAVSDRRFGIALVAGGLATCHNPPAFVVVLYASIVALRSLWNPPYRGAPAGTVVDRRQAENGLVTLQILTGILLSSLPVIFFWTTTGLANPIISLGFSETSLISYQRIVSEYFDLNIGSALGLPGTSALLVACALSILCSSDIILRRRFEFIRPLVIGLLLSFLMVLLTTSTTNWNHGQTLISRYAYWTSVPALVGSVACLDRLAPKKAVLLATSVVALQIIAILYYALLPKTHNRAEYLALKPVSRMVLDAFPGAYNPVPEIFAERVSGRDGVLTTNKELSVFAYPEVTRANKLMVREGAAEPYLLAMRHACGSASLSAPQEGWVYVNGQTARSCGLNLLDLPARLQPASSPPGER